MNAGDKSGEIDVDFSFPSLLTIAAGMEKV